VPGSRRACHWGVFVCVFCKTTSEQNRLNHEAGRMEEPVDVYAVTHSSLSGSSAEVHHVIESLKSLGIKVAQTGKGDAANRERVVEDARTILVFLTEELNAEMVPTPQKTAPRTEIDWSLQRKNKDSFIVLIMSESLVKSKKWAEPLPVLEKESIVNMVPFDKNFSTKMETLRALIMKKAKLAHSFDGYISHEWGDMVNGMRSHQVAIDLQTELSLRGLRVFCDRRAGGRYAAGEIEKSIQGAAKVFILLTNRYNEKLKSSEGPVRGNLFRGNLAKELEIIADSKGPQDITILAMKKELNDKSKWVPVLKRACESSTVIDASTKEKREEAVLQMSQMMGGSTDPLTAGMLGQSAMREAFEKALREDHKVPWGRAKLMIIGQGAAGKTSTVRSLLGIPPVKEWISTAGIDLKVTRTSDWKEHDLLESDFDMQAHKSAADYLRHRQAMAKKKHEEKVEKTGFSKRMSLRMSRRGSSGTKTAASVGKGSATPAENGSSEGEEDPVESSLRDMKTEDVVLLSEQEVARRLDFDWVRRFQENENSNQPEKQLSFSIWDYGGQEVFYALHHIFLTQFGIYLLVFDMREFLKNMEIAQRYVRFWLNSVKLYAPKAPLLLVGTYCDVVYSPKDHKKIDHMLRDELNLGNYSNVILNNAGRLRFFPVDNISDDPRRGVAIRYQIEQQALKQDYIKELVSLRHMKLLDDLLNDTSAPYFHFEDVMGIAGHYGIHDVKEVQDILAYFDELGVIIHLTRTEKLSKIVVTQPQWLLDQMTKVICDEIHIEQMYFDKDLQEKGLVKDFDTLRVAGIASRKLLDHLWHASEVEYLIEFMREMLLLCTWHFDDQESYLVTSLVMQESQAGDFGDFDRDEALTVVLDFSEFYLPDGVFQRLVSLCAEYSATFEDSMNPILKRHQAMMSFGFTEFLLEAEPDSNKILLHIPQDHSAVFDASRPSPPEVIKLLVSMFQFLNDIVMRNLVWRLLLTSPKEVTLAVEYDKLVEARKKGKKQLRAINEQRKLVNVSDFEPFFNHEASVGPLNSDADFLSSEEKVEEASSSPSSAAYDCFISHKQSSGGDMAALLSEKLKHRGFSIWYDQQATDGLTKAAMKDGILKSRNYMLLLTKDVFKSKAVLFELETAVRAKKNILLVHESDTQRSGFCAFGEYIATCPEKYHFLFESHESIPFQRRYFLEKAFLEELGLRIRSS